MRDVDWLDGAVLLLSAETFTRVGGLATDYFLYWEEVDLQLRVRRLGLPVRIDLGSRAQQAPGMAPPYLDARNSTLVLWRHGMRAALPASWWRQVRAGLGAAKRGEPWQLVARAAGVRDSVTGRMSSRWRLRRSAPRVGDL